MANEATQEPGTQIKAESGSQPAPAAGAQQKPAAAEVAQQKQAEVQTQVSQALDGAFKEPAAREQASQGSPEQQGQQQDQAPKSARAWAEMRRQQSALAAENKRLKDDASKRQQAREEDDEVRQARKDFGLDGDDKDMDKVADEAAARALQMLRQHNAEQQEADRRFNSAASAKNWLLSQSHLKDDVGFAQEVVALLKSDRFTRIAEADAEAAAQLAFQQVCEAKGLPIPAQTGASGAPSGRATGVRPTTPAPAAQKTFTREEVKARMSGLTPGTPEYTAARQEVEQAHREGRIT